MQWLKLPLSLALSVNFLDVPRAARGLYLDLLAHADADGVLVLADGQTPERAAALASPGDDPAPLLSELVRAHVVDIQPGRIVLATGDTRTAEQPATPVQEDEANLLSKDERRKADARARAKAWREGRRTSGSTPESGSELGTRTQDRTQSYADRTHTRTQDRTQTVRTSLSSSEIENTSEKKEEDTREEPSRTQTVPAELRTHTQTVRTAYADRTQTEEPLALAPSPAPKAKRLPVARPKLPWSIAAMLDVLASASGGAIVTAPMDGAHAVPLTNVIRNLEAASLTLDDVRLVGEWAAAGAFAWMGTPPGVAWLAKGGNLTDAVGKARAWRDGGRRPVTNQGNASAPTRYHEPGYRPLGPPPPRDTKPVLHVPRPILGGTAR